MRYLILVLVLLSNITPKAEAQTLSSQEQELYNLIMAYRATQGLPSIPASRCLTYVAQTHANDTKMYPPTAPCNGHSWSSNGSWTAVCYTGTNDPQSIKEKVWFKPRELTPYYAYGYEISSGTGHSATTPAQHLDGWKSSHGHNMCILGNGFPQPWNAIGVGIKDGYAHVWFGNETDNYNGHLPSPYVWTPPPAVAGQDILANNTCMSAWQKKTSLNAQYKFEVEGYFIYLKKNGETVWSQQFNMDLQCLKVKNDGNLVAIASNNQEIWSTGTGGRGSASTFLKMQDDGNLVLYNDNNTPIWATGTCGGVVNGCGSVGTR
ncbi:MAG: hypothetical protein IPL63_10075 [Saprospiraceae bacterium]|nr:hypothetical protein [Saprospiraceae bacterium]MBK7524608.1 hypothetical protein [Saprospiraceae bacterium]MBK8373066.1 hypothetical protein [Saprospiraceae bacterium]MBK8547705.1 hypothetical protein [Saprospiraceae bacterium]MBK8819358.1 hypothetical protein [Saprospiraceae bacterium]